MEERCGLDTRHTWTDMHQMPRVQKLTQVSPHTHAPIQPEHQRVGGRVVLRLHKHIEEAAASLCVHRDVPANGKGNACEIKCASTPPGR